LQRHTLNEYSIKNKKVMPRTKEQNEAIRAEKKLLIMDTAMQLFAENGFESTNIESIAQKAGISNGLLYSYFKNKDDLLYQIVLSVMEKIAQNFHPEMTIESFLADCEKFFDYMLENKKVLMLYLTICLQPKVMQKFKFMRSKSEELPNNLMNFLKKHIGEERAMQEILLYSVITNGFSVNLLTSSTLEDEQYTIYTDMLKKTVVNFIKERYSSIIK